MTRALELSHTRIVSGMHSTVDVLGGRIMATALAAAALADPANAALKEAARAQALAYFTEKTGTTADTLPAYAHSDASDAYADREANARANEPRLTYVLERQGRKTPLTVPKGAEVLLETRLPYLTAAQRREVLRTTALPSGYVMLDGFEQWGRLRTCSPRRTGTPPSTPTSRSPWTRRRAVSTLPTSGATTSRARAVSPSAARARSR